MRIYTPHGDLAFKTFDFPDGQPHFQLQTHDDADTVTVETRIKNPAELFMVMMVAEVLGRNYRHVHLDIRYLMAARMDRAIDKFQPYTLANVGNALLGWYSRVRILDPHSPKSGGLLGGYGVLPHAVVGQVLRTLGDVTIVIPDKGAKDRVHSLIPSANQPHVQILKHREMSTGKITSMEIQNPKDVGKTCLIVDDLCDGGATFVSAARLLREAGAEKVFLYVTHGIFSKKLPLDGIDNIFTTDSYANWAIVPHCSLVCIPVSMKDL